MKTHFYKMLNNFLYCIVVLISISPNNSFASGDIKNIGSRSNSLGGCMLNLNDLWSTQNNQAGMAEIKSFSFGMAYQNRFLIKETSAFSLATALPVKFGTLGISLHRFGYSAYSENKFGISYGRKLGNKLNIGLSLNYFLISIGDDYGNKGLLSFDIGFQAKISESLSLGLHAENPLMIKLNKQENEVLFSALRAGLMYSFNYPLFISLEAEKNNYVQKIIFRLGIEYTIKNKFSLRLGSSNSEEIFSFGCGLKLGSLSINLSAAMHNTLGFSPQSDIIFHTK